MAHVIPIIISVRLDTQTVIQALLKQNQQVKQGNMKFLESVTKIYEQSGRGDLASGLKNSISKAKQTI